MRTDHLLLSEAESRIEIHKHRATVQISNRITAQQRKIYNALLYVGRNALVASPETERFRIKQSQLKKLCGDSSTNNKQLQDNLKGLMSTVVEFSVLDDASPKQWHAAALLSEATIDRGEVYFGFASMVRTTLMRPDYHVLLDLNIIKGLSSKYAIALYENARDHLQNARELPQMPIDVFRKLMGVEHEKYRNFADLKKRVIDPSVEEICNKTDLVVEYELLKQGRRFEFIRFSVMQQERPEKEDVDVDFG